MGFFVGAFSHPADPRAPPQSQFAATRLKCSPVVDIITIYSFLAAMAPKVTHWVKVATDPCALRRIGAKDGDDTDDESDKE